MKSSSKKHWTMTDLNKMYSTTAINLGLVFKNAEGKYEKYKGSDVLFNKYGFSGLCFGAETDCMATQAFTNFKEGFTHITDPVLKVDKTIIAWLEYQKYLTTMPKYSCVSSTCYKIVDGVKTLAPEVTPSMLSSLYLKPLDWLALNKYLL